MRNESADAGGARVKRLLHKMPFFRRRRVNTPEEHRQAEKHTRKREAAVASGANNKLTKR